MLSLYSKISPHRTGRVLDSRLTAHNICSSTQLPCPPDAEVMRVELSDGGGLPSYSTVYNALATGVPLVVSGINPGESLTHEYFIQWHGEEMVKVINTTTQATRTIALATFMRKFGTPTTDPEKLKVCSSLIPSLN